MLQVCLTLIPSFCLPRHVQDVSNLCRQPANENKQFKETKIWISNSFLIRQSF